MCSYWPLTQGLEGAQLIIWCMTTRCIAGSNHRHQWQSTRCCLVPWTAATLILVGGGSSLMNRVSEGVCCPKAWCRPCMVSGYVWRAEPLALWAWFISWSKDRSARDFCQDNVNMMTKSLSHDRGCPRLLDYWTAMLPCHNLLLDMIRYWVGFDGSRIFSCVATLVCVCVDEIRWLLLKGNKGCFTLCSVIASWKKKKMAKIVLSAPLAWIWRMGR